MSNTPKTKNEAWGFYGTMDEQAGAAWPIAYASVQQATQGAPEAIVRFLDSRHGRYFADTVIDAQRAGADLDQAISKATERWMGWKIGKADSKTINQPRGTPHLVAFVRYHEQTESA